MKLSIVIVNFNTGDLLTNCLKSIKQSGLEFDYEVVVVDNNSQDESLKRAVEVFPQAVVVQSKKNLGFAAGTNQGTKKSQGEYTLFLGPDTIVNGEALEGLAEFLDNNLRVGIVGSKLLNPDGSFQWSVGPMPNTLNYILDKPLAFLHRYLGRHKLIIKILSCLSVRYYQGEKPVGVDWVSGAVMMVRKKVIEQIGGFDEKFFLYFEDNDFCLRARKSGWKIFYLPQFQIYHLGGQSSKDTLGVKEEWYYKSQDYFFKKHKPYWEQVAQRFLRIPYRASKLRSVINRYF